MLRQIEVNITLADLKKAKANHTLHKCLNVRDTFSITLSNGLSVDLWVEKVTPEHIWMGFLDGVAEIPYYENREPMPWWEYSYAREWCNTVLIRMLPEELSSMIVPRTIKQGTSWEEHTTSDLLWLHSVAELFGPQPDSSYDRFYEDQLPVYATDRDRIKMWKERICRYYTRSMYSKSVFDYGYKSLFVFEEGAPMFDAPDCPRVMAPGFWI